MSIEISFLISYNETLVQIFFEFYLSFTKRSDEKQMLIVMPLKSNMNSGEGLLYSLI